MNILCVVVDRLHAGYLGCFGNTWIATPAFDRLAAEGFCFQQALVDSPDLAEAYESLWRGSHALERQLNVAPSRTPLPRLARQCGLRTVLVTDEPPVAGHAAGADFDETAELEPPRDEGRLAAEVDATHTARLFTEAIDQLTATSRPFFLWLHARGLGGPWDAPPAFRERYVDEEDPPAPTFTTLAKRDLPPDVELDERFGIAQAYAGQVTLVDTCFGGLLEHLDDAGLADDTALALVSPRGIALGEHGGVGPWDDRLYGELVRVPWVLRLPGRRGALRRSQALVQPGDWYFTCAELLGASADRGEADWCRSLLPLIDGAADAWRDRALVVADDEAGVRTPAWYLRRRGSQAQAAGAADELFVEPDDLWQANDVADRCRDVVAGLRELEAATREAVRNRTAPTPAPHDDVLVAGIE